MKVYSVLIILCFTSLNLFASDPGGKILKYSVYNKYQKGKLTSEVSVIIQINNRSGEKLTKIEIPYSSRLQIVSLEAWIEDNDGKIIRKLKNKDISDISAIADFSLYEDDYIKKFQLRHNIYPYKVCYSYKYQSDEFLYLARWTPIIDVNIPTLEATLSLEIPADFKINIKEKNIAEHQIETQNGFTKYYWKTSYSEPIKVESYSPSLLDLIPLVKIVPNKFRFGIEGGFDSWESYGYWQYMLNENLNSIPDSEKSKIDKLVEGVDDTRERIKIIYNYLQDNTRYINVSIDIGGLKPYPASFVSSKKYGDCKALSNYMKSLLNYIGVHSIYSKVYAGDTPPSIDISFPNQQFNHVILAVPYQNDTIWLECTNNAIPFGYLGTFTQNRYALLVEEFSSHLVKTPSLLCRDVVGSRKTSFEITDRKNIFATMTSCLKGPEFELFNQLYTNYSINDQDEFLREYIPYPSLGIRKWELKTMDRDFAEIHLVADLVFNNFAQHYSNNIILEPFAREIPEFSPPDKRSQPVKINYPICYCDTLVFTFSPSMKVDQFPEDKIITSPFGKYERILSKAGNTITVIKNIEIFTGFYSLNQYPEFYKFITEVKKTEKSKLLFKTN